MINWWESLSIKRQLLFGGLGLLLLCLISYRYSIKKTIDLRRDIQQQQTILGRQNKSGHTSADIRSELARLDSVMLQSRYDRPLLFEQISSYCEQHDLKLRSFANEQIQFVNGLETIITPLQLEGGYADILRLVDFIERKERLAQIISLHFELNRDIRKKRSYLLANVYLQHYRKQ